MSLERAAPALVSVRSDDRTEVTRDASGGASGCHAGWVVGVWLLVGGVVLIVAAVAVGWWTSRADSLGELRIDAELIQQAGPLLSQINAPVFAFMLMKRISELAGVDQNYLTMFLKSKKKNLSSLSRSEISRSLTVTPYRRLIQILLHAPVYAKKLDPDLLMGKDDGNKERLLLVELVGFLRASSHSLAAESTLVAALQYFDHSPHCTLLEGIAQDMFIREADWDIEAEFAGGVARLKDAQRRSRMAELHSRPLASLTPEEKKELQRLILNG